MARTGLVLLLLSGFFAAVVAAVLTAFWPAGRVAVFAVNFLVVLRDLRGALGTCDFAAGLPPAAALARPVEPKPAAPRRLPFNLSASLKLALMTGASTSCAMRSPRSIITVRWPKFISNTRNSPR